MIVRLTIQLDAPGAKPVIEDHDEPESGRELVGSVVSLCVFDESYGWWGATHARKYGPFKTEDEAKETVEAFACRDFLINLTKKQNAKPTKKKQSKGI